jgi:membrane protein YdbS with pleckstrin-like domain
MGRKPIPAQLARLLADADPETRSRLEPRLTRAVNACGCSSGAFVLLLGVALSILWWLTQRDGRWLMWREAGLAVLAVVVATALGKLGGVLAARLWIVWTRRRLERRFGRPSLDST